MKHSLVRQTIIETAADLFYTNGYNLTGINEIIKEAGIAKATLYNHFKSKDEICIAYLNYKNTTFLNTLQNYLSNFNLGKERVLAIFSFLSEFYNDKDFNGCWCINTVSEIPKENTQIRQVIQEQKRQLIEYFNSIVVESYPNLNEEQQQLLSKRVYLLYETAVSESYLHQDNWPISESKSLCELLLK